MINPYATMVTLVAFAKDRLQSARRRAPPPSSTASWSASSPS
jgi:hypothetical protein